jgi:predicted Zn-dependent peptidase
MSPTIRIRPRPVTDSSGFQEGFGGMGGGPCPRRLHHPDDPGGVGVYRLDERGVRDDTLSNGTRVVTEMVPGVRSAAVGVWIKQGSAYEPPERLGISHMLEHMVFKGSQRRTAHELAIALEALGGSLDAYTTREHTSYQARVLDEHLPQAFDVLSDLILNPALRAEDLESEKKVVQEELSAVDDTPDDLVFELHGERFWAGHPYGHSILGTHDSVAGLTEEALRSLHAEKYRGSNMLIAAAGNVEHSYVMELAERLFARTPSSVVTSSTLEEPPIAPVGEERVDRPSAQTHVVIGTRTPSRSDPRRHTFGLLSAAFGGGMSSRLFQKVREELALAYSVFSYQSFYRTSGITGVYVATRPQAADEAVAAILHEYERLAEGSLGEEELEQTRNQVKGQMTLSLESSGARMYRLAGFALYDEPFLTLDQLLARIDAVTPESVAEVAGEFFSSERQFSLRLGP